MSVKVGVRVRPFNQREKDLNCQLCVDMIGPMTRLFNSQDQEKHRDFTFDYSFWSHDQFTPNQKGYFVADGDKYADQQHVFEQVGLEILSNAWQGYHCCLFAYGQTGAGKSYSMVGYGANKGIVPISCQEIFDRIAKNDNKNKEYQVHVSMLQIYNERVQDLLIPINKRSKQGLKIRQHKTLGVYVEGLSKHFVDSYDAIESKMQQGSANRSIAATEMNANSSRAHTIISIEFRQIDIIQNKKKEKLSVIYLVDLAGSQKVGKTGATGDRLKQAAGINKSLSVLGLVISTLADKATGKGKNIVVPYRDSCLTRILQNALGGNSKTLMICAISPANDNYEETLSTLRYADQAKKIQNKAVVNESETDKIIRNLKAEKDELMSKLQKFQEMFKKMGLGMKISEQELEQFNDAKQQLRFNNQVMNDYEMTKTQKKQMELEKQQQNHMKKVDTSKPHLTNLNEDPQLSMKIVYSIDKQLITIGKRGSEPSNDIQIGGMGIRSQHAKITEQEDKKIFVEPIGTNQDTGIYLNGDQLLSKIELKNMDRLSFGTNNIFIVKIPGTQPRDQASIDKVIDWQFAQNELYLRKQTIEKQIIEERQRKIKQQTELILKKKQQELEQIQKSLLQSKQMLETIKNQTELQKAQMAQKLKKEEQQKQRAERLKQQIEKDKKKMQDSETQQKQKIKEKYFFEKKLLKCLPKCIELNLIAKQFKRNISMSVKMLLPNNEGNDDEDMDMKKRSIKVKVVNREVGYTYWWDTVKLSNRYYIIKDMSEQYFETGVIPTLSEKDDPFWDPPEHTLIGRAFLTTKALAYMFDNPVNLTIIGQDDHCGQLMVNLVPTDQAGQRNLSEEMDQQEFQPQQLIDKPFYYNILIEQAKIPDNYQNIFVEYCIKIDEFKTMSFKTDQIKQRTKYPVFNYKKLHTFQKITEGLLDYLSTAKLIFRIYGYEMLPEEKKQTTNSSPSPKRSEINIPDDKMAEKKDTQQTVGKQVILPKPIINESKKANSPVESKGNLNTSGNIKNPAVPISTTQDKRLSKTTATPSTGGKSKKQEPTKKDKKQDCVIY